MKELAKGKAISFDLIGDELFEVKEYKKNDLRINLEKELIYSEMCGRKIYSTTKISTYFSIVD